MPLTKQQAHFAKGQDILFHGIKLVCSSHHSLGPHNPSAHHPEHWQLLPWPWLFIESMNFVFVVHANEVLTAGAWEGDLQLHLDTTNSPVP